MPKFTPILAFLLAFALWGCNSTTHGENEATTTPKGAVAAFVDSAIENCPNAFNNGVTREAFADSLASRVMAYQGGALPFLHNAPLMLKECKAYEDGGVCVLFQFETKDPRKIGFHVVSRIGNEDAARLVDGNRYAIDGTFRDFANSTVGTGFKFPNGFCRVDYPKTVDADAIWLGTLVIDHLTFKPYEKISEQ